MYLALECVTQKFATFSRRARRKEYWLFLLVTLIVLLILTAFDFLLGSFDREVGIGILGSIFSLTMIVPYIAVSCRRLHDTNRNGWWLFIYLIPFVGQIWFIILMCQKGTHGENRFGQDPLALVSTPEK
jgi:uncharacterized membrane protein YhaH (DUF805 family)